MTEEPINKAFEDLRKGMEKARKDLEEGIINASNTLGKGMQEYLNNTISIKALLGMIKRMGIPNIPGVTGTPMLNIDYYQVLGLNKGATNKQIKERYREIIQKLHPDIAGEEMTFLTALVNTAYSNICKERGM